LADRSVHNLGHNIPILDDPGAHHHIDWHRGRVQKAPVRRSASLGSQVLGDGEPALSEGFGGSRFVRRNHRPASTAHDFSRIGTPNSKYLSAGSSDVLLLGGRISFPDMKICMAAVILRGYILTI
jgi:hypothetical protein